MLIPTTKRWLFDSIWSAPFTVLKHWQLTSCHFHFNELKCCFLLIYIFKRINWSTFQVCVHIPFCSCGVAFKQPALSSETFLQKRRFQTWAVSIEHIVSPNCHWVLTIETLFIKRKPEMFLVSWCILFLSGCVQIHNISILSLNKPSLSLNPCGHHITTVFGAFQYFFVFSSQLVVMHWVNLLFLDLELKNELMEQE